LNASNGTIVVFSTFSDTDYTAEFVKTFFSCHILAPICLGPVLCKYFHMYCLH